MASIIFVALEPKTLLSYHRQFAPNVASPLCLGSMTFRESMRDLMGKGDKDTSFALLDFFFENGGNFIDTFLSPFLRRPYYSIQYIYVRT